MSAEREFKIYSDGFLFKLKWMGGGEMPAALGGRYTSYRAARDAGEKYKATRKPKVGRKSNGRSNTRA